MMVPVIAGAVHDGVEPGVGEAVLRVTGLDTERTAQVMLPTAPAQCTQYQYRLGNIMPGHSIY